MDYLYSVLIKKEQDVFYLDLINETLGEVEKRFEETFDRKSDAESFIEKVLSVQYNIKSVEFSD